MNEKPRKKFLVWLIRKILTYLIIISVGLYVMMLVMLLVKEDDIVYPAPVYPDGYWNQQSVDYEEVEFESADGTRLFGWFFEHESPRGVLMYFHGNGENVSHAAYFADELRKRYQVSVFTMDYRGYGKSEGSPNEEGVCADGRAAVEWLKSRLEIEDRDIILMGRSLGGGVAVRIASESDCRALILLNTFSSMPNAAAKQYPIFPVKLLMRNRFPSIDRIKNCEQPLIQVHGTNDQLAPFEQAQALFAASPSQNKTFVEMQGRGHNSAVNGEFWEKLESFLDELPNLRATNATSPSAHVPARSHP